MRGDVAKPVNAGGFHRGVGVKALGDGPGDESLAFLSQAVEKFPLLFDQPVDSRCFLFQKPRNSALGIERGKRNEGKFIAYCAQPNLRLLTPLAVRFDP